MKKKGQIGIILFFGLLFLILVVGFVVAISYSAIDFASDTITPVMTDLGVVGSTNLSEASQFTFGTVNTIVQNLGWLIGLAYVAALLFSIVFALVASRNAHPLFIGLYFALMLVLLIGCIIMSNVYEDLYTGNDEIAVRLQEQTLISYMILHSPFIMIIISLITGVFLFTRQEQGGLI